MDVQYGMSTIEIIENLIIKGVLTENRVSTTVRMTANDITERQY